MLIAGRFQPHLPPPRIHAFDDVTTICDPADVHTWRPESFRPNPDQSRRVGRRHREQELVVLAITKGMPQGPAWNGANLPGASQCYSPRSRLRNCRRQGNFFQKQLCPHTALPDQMPKIGRTLHDPEQMPGQKRAVLDWPYVEGLRMDEAINPLALMGTGIYGKDLLNQNGAPLRLVVPWKYGFKSIKSIAKIRFSETQPVNSWQKANKNEYGFFSNVNPEVSHPRWSQRKERRIGQFRKIKTQKFNGYAEQVASLYSGMDLKKNY